MIPDRDGLDESHRRKRAGNCHGNTRRNVAIAGKTLFVLLIIMALLPFLNLHTSRNNTRRRVLQMTAMPAAKYTRDSMDSKADPVDLTEEPIPTKEHPGKAPPDLFPDSNLLFKRIRTGTAAAKKAKKSVIVFVCTLRYCPAVASSIRSLRVDGGYTHDVAVILDESPDYNIANLKQDLLLYKATESMNSKSVRIFTVTQLFDSLLADQTADIRLREPPPISSCMNDHRKRGHRGYYIKTLIFHPDITSAYDTVLFMDSCMTFHSPHMHEILELPEIESSLLAAPDPWQWQKRGIGGRVLKCASKQSVQTAKHLVGRRLKKAGYFNTAFMFFDTAIVNGYTGEFGSSSSTLLELLTVYHSIGPAFQGNQDVLSTYFVYMRNLYRVLPHSVLGSPRVPYDFIKRMKKGSKYIVTAGNIDREVCKTRPTNKFATKK